MEDAGQQQARLLRTVLKLQPDNPIALNNLAFLLVEGGADLDQALTYAQRAKQKLPNDPKFPIRSAGSISKEPQRQRDSDASTSRNPIYATTWRWRCSRKATNPEPRKNWARR
jgi:hypothetical protein